MGVKNYEYEISIIMPCHNSLPYIKSALDTVFRQTFKNFELLLVDDGSIDGTFDYLKSVELEKDNVSVFRNPVQGAGASRNIGLSYARGNFVIFLDSDDLFSPHLLEELHASLLKYSSDIAVCEYESFISGTSNSSIVNSFNKLPFSIEPSAIDFKLMMLFDSAPWNKLIRRDLLVSNSIYFQNCKYANDLFAVYASIFSSSLISIVHKPLVRYRTGRSNSVQGKISKYPTEMLVPFRQLILDYGKAKNWRSDLIFKTFLMCYRSNFNNMGSEAVSGELWDAIREDSALINWLQDHKAKTRLWEDALFFCTEKMSFSDFLTKNQLTIKFFQQILPQPLKKYALLFSAVFHYLRLWKES